MSGRHYSKILVEFPDCPDDPPYATVSIDCMQCGKSEVKVHVQHLGSVLRVLDHAVNELQKDDGTTEALFNGFVPSTPDNKRRVREYLDRAFPGWLAGWSDVSEPNQAVNVISDEQFQRLRDALAGGASLREAASYAGVSKQTALRYRLLLGIEPQFAGFVEYKEVDS